MPYGDALDAPDGGSAQEIVQVTIPEGLSRREIATVVAAGLRGNYLRAQRARR